MIKTKILATAYTVPERVITNKYLSNSFDKSADELLAMNSVKERRYIDEDSNVSMAAEATRKALDGTDIKLEDIQMIICATSYPDHQFPGNSAFLQAELGLGGCAILDVRCQGAGYLSALQVADNYIRTGMFTRILVVGSDIHSTGMDYHPESVGITPHFGDGAGVAVLGPAEETEDKGILSIKTHTDGRYAKDWYIQLGSIQQPRITKENLEEGLQYPIIHWDVINREAVRRVPEVLQEACDEAGVTLNDLDLILVPNSSSVMIRRFFKATGIAEDKFLSVKHRFGNTGNAGVPIGWNAAVHSRKLKKGKLIAVTVYGSGFSYGAAIVRW